jgi:hypothetical protein
VGSAVRSRLEGRTHPVEPHCQVDGHELLGLLRVGEDAAHESDVAGRQHAVGAARHRRTVSGTRHCCRCPWRPHSASGAAGGSTIPQRHRGGSDGRGRGGADERAREQHEGRTGALCHGEPTVTSNGDGAYHCHRLRRVHGVTPG